MRVTLEYTEAWTGDLTVDEIRWTTLAAREFGAASFSVPKGHPAHNPLYLNDRESSLVRIEHPDLGAWEGAVVRIGTNARGATVEALQLTALTTQLRVTPGRVFLSLTAGEIMRQAILDCSAGRGRQVLRVGTILEAPPTIDRFEFTGQTLAELAAELVALTGHEWRLNNGAIDWLPPPSRLYEYVLTTTGDLIDSTMTADVSRQKGEVIAQGDTGAPYVARAGDVLSSSFWAGQERLRVGTSSAAVLFQRAETALAALRQPQIEYTARLRRTRA